MRFTIAAISILTLAGCAAQGGVAPLVSAQYPPGTSAKSEPQPITSLPPGAANISSAPGATEPSFASITIRAF